MVRATGGLVVGLSAFYLAYLVAGALVLGRLEGPVEEQDRAAIRALQKTFLDRHSTVSKDELDQFLQDLMIAGKKQIPLITSERTQWQFGNAFFFCSTLLTTIGYGNLAPSSPGGRVFCLAYLTFGLPLTCVLWAVYVDWFLRLLQACIPPRFHVLFLLMVVIFLVFGPSVAFSCLQSGWNYLDGVYYTIISLTTIGLGDLVAGENTTLPSLQANIYRCILAIYLLFGVAVVMTLLSRVKLDLDSRDTPEEKLPLHAGDSHSSNRYYGS